MPLIPVIAINNKGKISFQNNKARELFKVKSHCNVKDVFTHENWAKKIDTAVSLKIAVNINSIVGPLLVEVRAINGIETKSIGAVLVFHQPETIAIQSMISKSSQFIDFQNLVAKSANIQDVINRAKHMSHSDSPLVIYGASGVGKKTLAQTIHHSGKRVNQLFSNFDCTSVQTSLLEIELFGLSHRDIGKPGLLEIANNGTIHIQSIHKLNQECQSKLLNFIKNNYFYRVNGKNKKQVNVKIIASSPKPLKYYVENKQFNNDLFYALDIVHLNLPTLSERKEDIETLIQYFLNCFKQNGGKKIDGVSTEALNKIKSYNWPGNLTQLKDILFKASYLTKGSIIQVNDIIIDGHVYLETEFDNCSLPDAVAEFEKNLLQHWYKKETSTRKLAAHLGVSHTTIAQKLNKYSIN